MRACEPAPDTVPCAGCKGLDTSQEKWGDTRSRRRNCPPPAGTRGRMRFKTPTTQAVLLRFRSGGWSDLIVMETLPRVAETGFCTALRAKARVLSSCAGALVAGFPTLPLRCRSSHARTARPTAPGCSAIMRCATEPRGVHNKRAQLRIECLPPPLPRA